MSQLDPGRVLLEPFAGSGQIPKLVSQADFKVDWSLFDRDKTLKNVQHRDSIADFPAGFQATITNPP